MVKEILDFLKMNDVEYKENIKLSVISPIRIGAEARVVAYPDNEDKLIRLVCFLENVNICYKILGRMSNVLPPDAKYCGVIVRTDRLSDAYISEHGVSVAAGVSLPAFATKLAKVGLSGFEPLSGIPGSLGGALFGNAGAFGRDISEFTHIVNVYDFETGEKVALRSDQCNFSYRDSIFKQKKYLILSADLSFLFSDSVSVNREMRKYAERRMESQPVGKPSIGSTFKRPREDIHAAKLIDQCGLKGYKIGGALISPKHAGFIVNDGAATAKDYLSLANYAADQVYKKHKILLEREIEIL